MTVEVTSATESPIVSAKELTGLEVTVDGSFDKTGDAATGSNELASVAFMAAVSTAFEADGSVSIGVEVEELLLWSYNKVWFEHTRNLRDFW